MKEAALVHDMEALRYYGLEAGPHLNRVYEVSISKERCAGQVAQLDVRTNDGKFCLQRD